ncbi:hypothetical protein PFISCL1PPCAC_8049 [Pristionchus fissidentatus]|uniref:Uncharacterized protein n=1 Tax=Pristionchus fissidentatus TaxID=1538716 RepID=A0AAV5VF22_9BILA|nr:hypothetical protein PFISCL1PPCAC_8049 [Pristionchus fissidentatus]
MARLAPLESIDIEEALKDSPRFRQSLAQHTSHLSRLDQRVNEILKLVAVMADLGQTYVANFYKLSVCVNQMSDESFNGNPLAAPALRAISEAYAQTVNISKEFFENSTTQLQSKLQTFIKTELQKVGEARAHFEMMSGNMDEALTRNSSVSRTKLSEGIEGRNGVVSVGACFAHTTLDYVAHINNAHAHKNHVVVDALWGLVKEYSLFFHRGHAFFDEWTSEEKGAISDSVSALSSAAKVTERKMQDIHSIVNPERLSNPSGMSPDPDVVMEGYLYKRSSNALRKWNRRWFQIKDSKLLYSHRSSDMEEPTVMEENLMLCLVKPASATVDRTACFELVTPTRSHLLQADSEMLCNGWMRALQRTILHLHESHQKSIPSRDSSLPSSNGSSIQSVPAAPANGPSPKLYEQLRKDKANRCCGDCGEADPKWVSINLGLLLCIECAGLHRSLGVHVSKVRSLTMDSFDAETQEMIVQMGNTMANSVFISHLPSSSSQIFPPPATPSSSREAREAWIRAKYVDKRFASAQMRKSNTCTRLDRVEKEKERYEKMGGELRIPRSSSSDQLEDTNGHGEMMERLEVRGAANGVSVVPSVLSLPRLFESARTGDLKGILSCIVSGVEMNGKRNGETALHVAVREGQTSATELLLVNGAKVEVKEESEQNTPLHVAAKGGMTLGVCQLLRRGANQNELNGSGATPLQLAVDAVHADIVTIFRVHSMRDQFAEEFNNPMDETVSNVVQDITRKAGNRT